MSKSSFLNNKFTDKSNIAIVCLLGIMAGFLISRAELSIAMMLFGLNALLRPFAPLTWFRHKWWLTGALWIGLYALTWYWTADKGNWDTRLQVKMPILLLPLAFAYIPRFTARQVQVLAVGIGAMLLAGVAYSLSFLLHDMDKLLREYHISHMLPTPAKNDYLRFSLAIVLYIVWGISVWPQLLHKAVRWFTGIALVILGVYIHILASKTGLISLYLFLAGWGVYLSFGRRRLLGIAIVVLLPVAVLLAVRYIPTLHERAKYIDYTVYMFRHGDRTGSEGDIGRIISYDIALRLIKQHPATGAGAGDIQAEMDKGYTQWYPAVQPGNRLQMPHNQLLVVTLGCGISTLIVFMIWLCMPLGLLHRNRESFFFFMAWLLLLVQLMVEPVLEVQLGVFVYVFFLLLQRHMLTAIALPQPSPRKREA